MRNRRGNRIRVARLGMAAAAIGGGLIRPGPAPAAQDATTPAGDVAVVQISGKGFGHGVGMAQDGELAMGEAGAGTD